LFSANNGGQLTRQFNNYAEFGTFFSLPDNPVPVSFALINYSQKLSLTPQQFNFSNQTIGADAQNIIIKCPSTFNNKFTAQLFGGDDATQLQALQTVGLSTESTITFPIQQDVYSNYQVQIIENATKKVWYTAPVLQNTSLGVVLPTIVHNLFTIKCLQANTTYSVIDNAGHIVQNGNCAIGNNSIDFAAKQNGNYQVVLQSVYSKQVTQISKQ
jgi:hypothetical protein